MTPTPEALAEASAIIHDWQMALNTGFAMNRDDLEILYRRIAATLSRREPPPGWVMVPKEPTAGMLDGTVVSPEIARLVWQAMIAVSSWSPPQEKP